MKKLFLLILLFFLFSSNLFSHEEDNIILGCTLEWGKDFLLDKDKQEFVPAGYDPNDFDHLKLEIYFVGDTGIEFEHNYTFTPYCKYYRGGVKPDLYFATCYSSDHGKDDYDGKLYTQNYIEIDRLSGDYFISYMRRENKKNTYLREYGGVCKKIDRKL